MDIANLRGKRALVTGAGQGIGRAIALALAGAGADVTIADLNEQKAKGTASEIERLGRKSLSLRVDVSSLPDIDRMVTEAVRRFGGLDVMVNNAGVTRYAPIMELTEADWDSMHRVNAKGTFFAMQRAARQMIEQGKGGRIINIASISGKAFPGGSNAAYAASKAAVIVMSSVAALQLAQYDINVNAICPGITDTPLGDNIIVQGAQVHKESTQDFIRRRLAPIPLGRQNDPEDIGAMAVFLAGPGGRNITGQSINVDGGLVMH
ncbi:MAG: glucose 1-dehydrogenase [SAR202 cluster bacterium]|nr:glucose 1-dehydrogenase [SAR202 cluster bacterium]